METTKRWRAGCYLFSVVWLIYIPHADAQESSLLTYALDAAPGSLTVDRMPTTGPPRQYAQTFTFTVSNTRRTDYKGSTPSCKTYDVEVFRIEGAARISVWKWSSGRRFCQMVTPVNILAGKKWGKVVVWKFKTSDIKDGQYTALATFEATSDKSASTAFQISSVQ